MSFPENALLEFLYNLINTPGVGGIAVSILGMSIFLIVGLTLRWIKKGADVNEIEEYTYPTSSLLEHD